MMSLKDAARVFETNVFTDTYGSATFKGQILPYPDSVRSGAPTRRRILEVAPEVVIPTRRTVTCNGVHYIVSFGSNDLFNNQVIRVKYPILPVDTSYNIRSIGEVLANSGGTSGYMAPSYIRRVVLEDNSAFDGGYEIYLSTYNTVPRGHIVVGGGRYFKAREASRTDDIGFAVFEATELITPVSTMTFQAQGGTYNPTNDTYNPPAAISNVSVFIEHSILDFEHEQMGYVKIEEGDKAISFLKSQVSAVKVGDRIGNYQIMGLDDRSTYWTTHARRVA